MVVGLSLCLNVCDSIISIEPSSVKPSPKYSSVGCDVISDFPAVHIDKSIEDCVGGEWATLVKCPTYEIYSVYLHLIKKIGTDKPINICLSGGEYNNCKFNGGY
jgi:hypothetical protein